VFEPSVLLDNRFIKIEDIDGVVWMLDPDKITGAVFHKEYNNSSSCGMTMTLHFLQNVTKVYFEGESLLTYRRFAIKQERDDD